MKVSAAVALAMIAAACNRGDSDNVMAASGNALTPAQVDLALGPELSNFADNRLQSPNDVNAIEAESAVESADREDAIDEAVADEPGADQAPNGNTSNPEQ